MRFVLTPVGSGGDVHPYIGLGGELRRRGHEVVLIGPAVFREAIEAADIDFVAVGTIEDYERATLDPDLWHPRRGMRVVMRILADGFANAYELIERVWKAGESVLVGHTIAFHARVFEEVHDAPAATIHLAPNVFRSEFAQPAIAPGLNPTVLPRSVKRTMWRALDRFVIDPMIAPALNRWRSTFGLPPVARVFDQWLHSPRRVIALFPDWFATPQPDWPPQLRVTSFPLFDDPDRETGDGDLERWLDGGDRPIVFTPGTANVHAKRFFEVARDAAVRLRRRALFLTTFEENLPPAGDDRIRHERYVPFSKILPRCAALVHHGGIGTCAQGLAAGIPQLVMPMGFDQPDNADRVANLGAGSWIVPRRFTPPNVARALERLLGDEGVARACATARDRLRSENGIVAACDLLERLP